MASNNPWSVNADTQKLPNYKNQVTKLYHGAEIFGSRGGETVSSMGSNLIGRILTFNPVAYTRAGSSIRELNKATFGKPVDYVPGIVEDHTIALSRVELWNEEIEIAFGVADNGKIFNDLGDQTAPITIWEQLSRGNGGTVAPARQWLYQNCWFQERNETEYSADGDGKIIANCTIAYTWRFKLL